MSAAHSLPMVVANTATTNVLSRYILQRGFAPDPLFAQTAADHDTFYGCRSQLSHPCRIVHFCVPVPDRGKSGTKSVPIWGQIRYLSVPI